MIQPPAQRIHTIFTGFECQRELVFVFQSFLDGAFLAMRNERIQAFTLPVATPLVAHKALVLQDGRQCRHPLEFWTVAAARCAAKGAFSRVRLAERHAIHAPPVPTLRECALVQTDVLAHGTNIACAAYFIQQAVPRDFQSLARGCVPRPRHYALLFASKPRLTCFLIRYAAHVRYLLIGCLSVRSCIVYCLASRSDSCLHLLHVQFYYKLLSHYSPSSLLLFFANHRAHDKSGYIVYL